MKDLDQPSRASLRKYGVRFGAYHIYIPALLKPAARALASLLWAQKQDVDMSALSGAQHLAGSGRTSFPVDKQLPRDAYRVLGYRQCGERAVRVDILERLADLIRPALSWRETSPGEKPAGAFDGRGFVVTQAMTSLTGSAGEDFASILRALGYRMERRPPPPPKPAPVVEAAVAEAIPAVVEAAAVEAAPAEAASETLSEAAAIEAAAATANLVPEQAPVEAASGDVADIAGDAPPTFEDAAPAPSANLLPDNVLSPSTPADEPASVEANSIEAEPIEVPPEPMASIEAAPAEAAQDQPAAEVTTETVAAGDTAPVNADAAATAPETVAAPELVEVWRPGGRSDERRPRHDRSRHRHQDRPKEGEVPVAAAGEAGEAAKGERHRRGRRDRNNEFRKPRTDAPLEAAAAATDGAPVREPREDKGRPPRERFRGRDKDKGRDADQQKGKFAGGRDNGGRDKGGRDKRPDGGPSHRPYATSAAPRERDRPIDPNSPFAKLAALKEQLTANRKDR
jgi:ATP-dependent RNA helicase SUPV3L1/SUV3